MNIRARVVAASVAVLALTGGGIGAAVAASANTAYPHAVVSEPTSPDNDAVQQGDQTTPDRTTAAATNGENGSENNSSENASSDGPHGWADPSGNAQHEFNGVE